VQAHGANGRQPEKAGKKPPREVASNSREGHVAAE
jgi:hypothetical protein